MPGSRAEVACEVVVDVRSCWVAMGVALLLIACGEANPSAADATVDTASDAAGTRAADAAQETTPDTAPGADATPEPADVAPIQRAGGVIQVPATPPGPKPPGLRVTTYNVMCSFCVNSDHKDWVQPWPERVPWLRAILQRENPDLAGLQEQSDIEKDDGHEITDLTKPDDPKQEPTWVGLYYHHTPGDDLPHDYPDAAILYRKARFDVLDQGQFWLSPTPEKAFSIGFAKNGAQFPRLVYWALLDDKPAKRKFYFASTHFDNNAPSQELSAALSLDRFAPLAAKYPVVFVGDFNSKPASTAYAILTKGKDGKGFSFQNAWDLAPAKAVETDLAAPPVFAWKDRIDHVFLAGAKFTASRWAIDWFGYGGKHQWPSDHEPIYADIDWQ